MQGGKIAEPTPLPKIEEIKSLEKFISSGGPDQKKLRLFYSDKQPWTYEGSIKALNRSIKNKRFLKRAMLSGAYFK